MFQDFINKLAGASRSWTVRFNAVLLALAPFSDEIIAEITNQMPTLHEYLPDNIYKAVGYLLVVGNLYLRFRTKLALELK